VADLNTVVAALLDCARTALSKVTAGVPGRVCDVPGLLAWDGCDCGVLAVTVDRIYPSATFPVEAADVVLTSPCPPPYDAVDMTVTVLRCAPSPDDFGWPPSCDQLAAAAEVEFEDLEAIRGALACCLAVLTVTDTIAEWTLRDTTPAGPQGGCVGTGTHLTIGMINCACRVG
jgi:hypothetical protein